MRVLYPTVKKNSSSLKRNLHNLKLKARHYHLLVQKLNIVALIFTMLKYTSTSFPYFL